MTGIPIEAGEVRRFTPPSLANLPSPPTFLLKPAGRREKRAHGRLIVEAGLRRHSQEAMRDEMIRALSSQWSPELVAEHEPRLRAYWDALDCWIKQVREQAEGAKKDDGAETPRFEHPDKKAIDKLNDQIVDAWPPLRKMAADNIAFDEESPLLMACCLVLGWENVSVPFALEAGNVPVERMEEMSEWLGDLEQEKAGQVEGIGARGTAFAELCLETGKALYLDKAQEKNSGSPSPTTSTQSISTGEEATASSSKASDTPAAPAT